MTDKNTSKNKSQTKNQETDAEVNTADNGSYGSGLVAVNTIILGVFAIIALVIINNNGYFEKYAKSNMVSKAEAHQIQGDVKGDQGAESDTDYSSEHWVTPHISKQAKIHILYGDETGGAHFHTVTTPCKSLFPKDWSADKVIEVTEKIAANDNLDWKMRKNGKMFAQEMYDGILTRVIMDTEREYVITSYPLNADRNPCPKNNSEEQIKKSGKAVKETKYFKVLDVKSKSSKEYNQ